MKTSVLRGLGALALVALLSCGGGGSADGDASHSGVATDATASSIDWGFGSSLTGAQAPSSDHGGGDGNGGDSSGAGAGAGGGGGGGGGGDSSGSASASAGDGSGVGSGGTGASASAGSAGDSGVGGVGGVGSIIVNGVRYDTGGATLRVRDVPTLRLGMTVKVIGPTSSDFTTGTAFDVESAVDVRGGIVAIDRRQGSFTLLGTTVQTDSATVLGNIIDISALAPGDTVQVWGLPTTPGAIHATRVERLGAGAAPIITGTVQALQAGTGSRSFRIGALTIDAAGASIPEAALVEGMNVRVRAAGQPSASTLRATSVELWYPVSQREGMRRQLGGVVTDFAGLQLFRVLGVPVDARQAQVTGGLLSALDNGAELDVAGTVTNGVLVASTVRIRKTPGGLNTTAYSTSGPIGGLRSLTSFTVRGQPIDASAALLQLVGGTLADLRNGARVTITGDRVVNDVLIASRIVFD